MSWLVSIYRNSRSFCPHIPDAALFTEALNTSFLLFGRRLGLCPGEVGELLKTQKVMVSGSLQLRGKGGRQEVRGVQLGWFPLLMCVQAEEASWPGPEKPRLLGGPKGSQAVGSKQGQNLGSQTGI